MLVRIIADADWIPELDTFVDGEVERGPVREGDPGTADVMVVPMGAAEAVRTSADDGIPTPVVWVVPKEAARSTLEALSAAAVASRFVFAPDPELVADAVRELVAARAAERRRDETDSARRKASASMEDLWKQFRGTMLERLEALERVGAKVLVDEVTEVALEEAHHAAHKLHGSLGTFGLHRGSELASDLEALVEEAQKAAEMPAGDRYRFTELVVGLRREIEAGRPSDPASKEEEAPGPGESLGSILIVESEPDRREKLGAAALARGWRPERTASAREALEVLGAGGRPDIAVLDPAAGEADALEQLLTELAAGPDPVPVLFQGRTRTLDERLQAVTLGARVFVDREASADAVLGRAESLLDRGAASDTRILAVDDDPTVLRVLTFILRGAGFTVRTLESPLEFWRTLEAVEPDLLLLDVEMPDVNGFQLCRAVRADSRWHALPILFLTAHTDPQDVVAGFRAGADDFVAKPVAGPELLARVESHLARMTRAGTGVVDRETGLDSRQVGIERLHVQVAIAGRHDDAVTVAVVRLAGDETEDADRELVHLSGVLEKEVRPEDVVARWDRNAILVSRYGENEGDTRRWLERYLPEAGVGVHVGLAAFPEEPDVRALVEQATASGRPEGPRAGRPAPEAARVDAGPVDADIVIVEDDEALGTLLTETLGERGYETHWETDGARAAKLLTGKDPAMRASLIILDVGLPGMDGLSLLRRLARDGITRRTRVLMLTARSAESEVVKALELGAFDHVPKPFSVSELIHRVRRALGDRGRT